MYPVIFIIGQTATGKSKTSFELARLIDAEIIYCDSMAIYKEISILSDKPDKGILKEVPHHMLNIASVKEECNVFDFYKKAIKHIEALRAKSKK